MPGRTPKASDHSNQVASDPAFEAPASQSVGRGGPILEESNVLISINRSEPSEPQNYVARFFRDASSDPGSSVSLAVTPRMDVAQYWEKRRVQNVLRRVLEAIQERFNLDGEVQSGDFGTVFDIVAQRSEHEHRRGPLDSHSEISLPEPPFIAALDALGLWPPELSPEDRSEIFHALLVPSIAAARGVLSEKTPMRNGLTRRLFREGFECVPFNLPDFPVPTHLMTSALQLPLEKFTSEQRNAVTEAVATTFCLEKTGVDKAKDFFMCGLLSLEEIQMGLPRLLPHAVVEDAVTRVIRKGAPLMSAEEWHNLVLAVRTPQACGQQSEEQPVEMVASPRSSPQREVQRDDYDLASQQGMREFVMHRAEQHHMEAAPSPSPGQSPATHSRALEQAGGYATGASMFAMPNTPTAQSRDVQEVTKSLVEMALCGLPSLASPMADHRLLRAHDQWGLPEGDADIEQDGAGHRFRGRFEPVTEPLPCRTLRSEEPVSFVTAGNSAARDPARVPDIKSIKAAMRVVVATSIDEGFGRLEQGQEGVVESVNEANGALINFFEAGRHMIMPHCLSHLNVEAQGPKRVVDWNTAVAEPPQGAVLPLSSTAQSLTATGSAASSSAAEPENTKLEIISWHKADECAGSRLSWGTSCFKQELAASASKSSGTENVVLMPGGADPTAWINIDLHHECGGPYLTRAFVRCCQLFVEARKRGTA